MFHCPVGFWVIEQHAIILSATVRYPTVSQVQTVGSIKELKNIFVFYKTKNAIIYGI